MELRVVSGERDNFVKLLELAEDSPILIQKYLKEGELLEFRVTEETVGCVLLLQNNESAELKYVAIYEKYQCKGYGTKMLELTELHVTQNYPCVRKLTLNTATSSGRRIEFYQRCGFRPWKVERDYFDKSKGYKPPNDSDYFTENNIPIRDTLWFDKMIKST